jgi:alkanesulfonate monooxygenase
LGYLSQIACAAGDPGYFGVLLPTGRSCEDFRSSSPSCRPRFLVAVRPGLSEPLMTARIAATLDHLSAGLVLINVIASGDPEDMHGDGVWFASVGLVRGGARNAGPFGEIVANTVTPAGLQR